MAKRTDPDDFERTSGIGTGWVVDSGTWGIANGRLGRTDTPATVTAAMIRRTPGRSYGPNQFAKVTLGAGFSSTTVDGFLIQVRHAMETDSGSIVATRYGFGYLYGAGGGWLIKDDGGPTTTDMAGPSTAVSAPVAGDVITVVAAGERILGFNNGALVLEATISGSGARARYAGELSIVVRNVANQTASELFEDWDGGEWHDTEWAFPDGTQSAGGWSFNTVSLEADVAEDVPDTTNSDVSAALTTGSDALELTLPTLPADRQYYMVHARARKNTTGGRTISGLFELLQGTTVLGSLTKDNTALNDGSGWVDISFLVTAPTITDGTDLRLRVTATGGGAGASRKLAVATFRATAAENLVAIAQVTETEVAQAMGSRKAKAIAQLEETDLAQTVSLGGGGLSGTVGQVTETDLSQALAVRKAVTAGQVPETDLAQALTARKAAAVGQVLESDSAQIVGRLKAAGVGQISELDLAQSIARIKIGGIGQVTEVDLAQSVGTGGQLITVSQVTELDAAQSVAWAPKARLVGQVVEVDLAQGIAPLKLQLLLQTVEVDTSQPVARRKTTTVAQVIETDLAQAVALAGGYEGLLVLIGLALAPGSQLGSVALGGGRQLGSIATGDGPRLSGITLED